MKRITTSFALFLVVCAAVAHANNLVLPAFAHNVSGQDGSRWSSEIYLTNPGEQPVQVTLVELIPGYVKRPTPCDLFMPPTRVVPPRSAVVWTAGGLAVDLGCAEEALGGLVLNADGPVRVESRLVNHSANGRKHANDALIGLGQEVRGLPVDELPGAGSYILPALVWKRDSCDGPAFDTYVGFVNPGSESVTVTIYISSEQAKDGILLDGSKELLPLVVNIPARAWHQVHLDLPSGGQPCAGPERFDLHLGIDGPLAAYASVVDRSNNDARTVEPIRLD